MNEDKRRLCDGHDRAGKGSDDDEDACKFDMGQLVVCLVAVARAGKYFLGWDGRWRMEDGGGLSRIYMTRDSIDLAAAALHLKRTKKKLEARWTSGLALRASRLTCFLNIWSWLAGNVRRSTPRRLVNHFQKYHLIFAIVFIARRRVVKRVQGIYFYSPPSRVPKLSIRSKH